MNLKSLEETMLLLLMFARKVLEQGDLIKPEKVLRKWRTGGATVDLMDCAVRLGRHGSGALLADSELWDLENVVVTPHIRYEYPLFLDLHVLNAMKFFLYRH